MARMSRCSPEIPNIGAWVYRALRGLSIQGLVVLTAGLGFPLEAFSDETTPNTASPYLRVTGQDEDEAREGWDRIFRQNKGYLYGTEPAPFLKEQVGRLPVGRALDIAMGEGRNAVYLAKRGFRVEGVDFSSEAIRKAERLARSHGVAIQSVNADLNQYSIRPESYDAILNINFVLRSLIPKMKRGLRRGGVVIFEARLDPRGAQGFRPGELRSLFADFEILVDREATGTAEPVVSLVARKP